MLFFDLDRGTWVDRPGSASPPQSIPVLTIGAVYQIPVSFIRGESVENVIGGTFYAGIKIKGDFSGDILADDDAPTQESDEFTVFSINLTTEIGKSYFTENPTKDVVSAVFVVSAAINENEFKTPPFELALQNDYFP